MELENANLDELAELDDAAFLAKLEELEINGEGLTDPDQSAETSVEGGEVDSSPTPPVEPTPASGGEGAEATTTETPGEGGAAASEGVAESEQGEKPTDPAEKVEGAQPAEPSVDYAEVGKAVLGPIKANGRITHVKDVDEAISLMQKGLHYNKQMQKLQPVRRQLAVLQDSGLDKDLDGLALLADVYAGNKDALKRFLKDRNIDPFELDLTEKSNYIPGLNLVGDKELEFRAVMDEVTSLEGGADLVAQMNSDWDPASKQAAWENPAIITAIYEAKQTKTYDVIVAEVERLKAVGKIPMNTPFLQAYSEVGKLLAGQVGAQGGQGAGHVAPTLQPAAQPVIQQEAVVSTRVASPRTTEVVNGDKARAASQSTPVTRAAPTEILYDPKMSDEDFLKQFDKLASQQST